MKAGAGHKLAITTGGLTAARLALRLLAITMLALGAAAGARAQSSLDHGTPAESKTGTSTASTYAPDKLETVNLANGNLSAHLPLVTVGGRGSASYTVALSYNSKLWSTEHEKEDTGTDPFGDPNPYVHHYYAWYDDQAMSEPNIVALGGGWRLALGPALKAKRVNIGAGTCTGTINSRNTCYQWTLTKMWLTLPDGSEVELRDQYTQGAPHYLGGQLAGAPDRWRGRVWVTTDGSAATFVTDADNGVVNGQLAGWVFLADGMRLRMEAVSGFGGVGAARCTQIVDRNGNFVTISTNDTTWVTTYTDELGRQTVIDSSSPSVVNVTVKGYGGVADRVFSISIDQIGAADGQGVLSNLRADFRSLPRPFTSGDYARTASGDLPHTLLGPHTDLFLGSESMDNIDDHFVVTSVALPDGRALRFRYNQYGEVAEVDYPGGGVSQIDYQGFQTSMCEGIAPYTDTLDRRVTQRRLLTDGADVDATWSYAYGTGTVNGVSYPEATLEAHAGSNGALLLSETHYFLALKAEYRTCHPRPSGDVATEGTSYERWDNAKEFRVERQTGTGTEVTVRQWEQRAPVAYLPEPDAIYTQEQPANDPRVVWEETTLETGKKRRTEYTYDDFNNVTSEKEYDYGDTTGSTGALIRQTLRTYAGDQPSPSLNGYCYTNLNPSDPTCGSGIATDITTVIHQRRLLLNQTVKDGAGNQEAYSSFEYDNYSADADHASLAVNTGMTGYDGTRFSAFPAASQPRGNVTKTSAWIEGSSYVTSYARYDDAGNVVSAKDARGYVSTISYADNFGDGSNPDSGTVGPNGATYAFATLATDAMGHQAKSQYDYTRGVATGAKDANGVISKTEYDDLGRAVRATAALNVPGLASVSEMSYPTASENAARVSKQLDATRWAASKTDFDGFDRPVLSGSAEDGQHASQANFTIFAKTIYDPLGRVKMVTNPYRAQSAATDGWARTTYDLAGRVTEVAAFSGDAASQPPDTGTNENWTGSVVTTYAGDQTTVRDQANKQRRSIVDGLGRLKSVDEMLEYPSTAVYATTTYDYDARGNLKTVSQSGQTRSFVYDGLSRMKSATNPESGMVNYTYDPNGNLATKTDARGIVTTYGYDALNRNITVDYQNLPSDPANAINPDISRFYDNPAAGKYGMGRFWYSYAGGDDTHGATVEQTKIDGYDAMGRPLTERQLFKTAGAWGTAYLTSRIYDLAGHVTQQTYPSEHTVNYTQFDGAGRLLTVTGNLGDGKQRTYATGISYDAASRLTQEQFGTATPLYHRQKFNSRGQLVDARLGTAAVAPAMEDWDRGALMFDYGTTDNNGNLHSQSNWIQLDAAHNYTQTQQNYNYDPLNRLQRVTENRMAGPVSFQQTYAYDVWGNRQIDAGATTDGLNKTQFDARDLANTNRLYAPGDLDKQDSQRAMRYDAAGNLTQDTYSAHAAQRAYDGENRMTTEQSSLDSTFSYYTYDADGHRTRRDIGGNVTWQVYGFDGELLAEYTANAQPSSPQKEYGYRSGEMLIVASPATLTAAAPTNLTAAPSTPGTPLTITLSWAGTAASYRVERSATKDGPYSLVGTTSSTDMTDAGATAGVAYLYRVCAADASSNCTSPFGNVAMATAFRFTDDPIKTIADDPTGATVTTVKATHVLELRQAVDAVRVLAGIGAAAWGETPATGVEIRATHIQEVRDRLKEALLALGLTLPTYTDSTLQVGVTGIQRAHFAELRLAATKGVSASGGGGGTAASVEWLVADHLGTPRMIVDQTGALSGVRRHDYLPFGEELLVNQWGRTTEQGFGDDNVRHKFTKKERDGETGLDYFGARYYSPVAGRFTTTDPYDPIILGENSVYVNMYLANPQRWNKYTYGLNNPLKFIDPDGNNPVVAAAASGALAGAIVGGGIELLRQIIHGEHIDVQKIAGKAIKGATFGAAAGATGGFGALAGLGYTILATGTANIIGGVLDRLVDGDPNSDPFNFTDAAVDGAAGAAGGGAGYAAQSYFLNNIPGAVLAARAEAYEAWDAVTGVFPTLERQFLQAAVKTYSNPSAFTAAGAVERLIVGVPRGAVRAVTGTMLTQVARYDYGKKMVTGVNFGTVNIYVSKDSPEGKVLLNEEHKKRK